jgi:hypothetical protein
LSACTDHVPPRESMYERYFVSASGSALCSSSMSTTNENESSRNLSVPFAVRPVLPAHGI